MTRLQSRVAVGFLTASIAVTLAGCPGPAVIVGTDTGMTDGGMIDTGPIGHDGGMGMATLTIAPALQDYGDVVMGMTSSPITFTVTNTGMVASGAMTANLGGSGAGDFTVGANSCTGMHLAPAGTCTVVVTFSPSAVHSAMATLTATDGTAMAPATLEGRGVPPVGLSITPSPYNFGTATVGTPTAAHTFTVTNLGGTASAVLDIQLGGLDSTQFMLGADMCSTHTLAAHATCTVDVIYGPTSPSMPDHSGILQATAGGVTANATLAGRAQTPAGLRVVPTTRDFGSVVSGSQSAPVDFTVTNTGGVATGSLGNMVSGASTSEFVIASSTCAGAPLAGGASCTISVVFHAGAPGAKTASLDVTAGTLSAHSILSGNSQMIGSINITPSTHDFGTSSVGVAVGATTFTISNPAGSASVGPIVVAVAGANPADFPIVAGSNGCTGMTLAGGASCTVAVQFVPGAIGGRTATLTANGGSAALSGTGQNPAMITLLPTAADFGSVAIGGGMSTVNFTVMNTGGAPTGAITANLTGAQSTQFSIVSVGACSAPLAGGASCTITVRFSPTTVGAKAAVLNVSSPSGGTRTSDVTGTGITMAALMLSTAAASFGNVAETDSALRTITVTNNGMETVTALTSSITGTDAAQFVILGSSTCGATLLGMSSCTIDIRFTSIQGAVMTPGRLATLTVTGTPGGAPTAALSATEIPDLLIAPTTVADTLDYGSVVIGSTVLHSFTVTNQTIASHTLVVPVVTGADFTRTGGTCVAGLALAPAATCTVTVTFAPTGAAGARSATLNVSGSGGVTETVNLLGTAAGPLRFRDWQITRPAGGPVTATYPAAFGDRSIGNFYEVTLTAVNGAVAATSAVSTSSSFTGDLNIVSDTCSGTAVAPMATCAVVVRFYPRVAGAVSGTVTLTYGVNSVTANITGNGIVGASIGVTGTADFGNVIATRTLDRTFTVTNASPAQATGVLSYSVSGASEYTLVSGAGAGTCPVSGGAMSTIPASGSCTIVVRFSPIVTNATGPAITGTLVVQQGAQTVNTAITGHATSQITVTPATAAFQTGVGTTSATSSFLVTNVGAVSTGSIVATMGSFSSEFPITNNTCSTLAAGATCSFDVAFSPTANVDRAGVEVRVSNGAYFAGTARVAVSTVSGDAASQASLSITPVTTNAFSVNQRVFFGWIIEGTNSDTYTFTVRNNGDLPSAAMSVALDNNGCPFGTPPTLGCTAVNSYDILANGCTGALAGGASCTFQIRFSPEVGTGTAGAPTGTWQTGSVLVSAGPASVRGWVIGGSVVAGNNITVTPTPVDFGSVAGGTTVGPRTFMVSNNTGSTITLGTITAGTARFTTAPGTCTNGSMVTAGGTCSFTVTYAPPAGGPFGYDSDQITVGVTAGSVLQGFGGVSGISLAPATLSVTPGGAVAYPTTVSGNISAQTFTVTNTGGVPMAATAIPAISGADPSQFVLANNTCTSALAAGASCTFDVNFAPTGAGGRSATLTVTAGVLSTTRALSGSGTAAGLLGISPSAPQSCPDHFAGSGASATYACVTYTVSNGGGSAANVSAAVTGDFRVDPTSTCVTSPSLAAGGNCTVIVQHTPPNVGADSGTLTVSAPGIASVTGTISTNGLSALTATGTSTFGSVAVGGSGMMQTFTFTNQTDPSTGILFYTLSGSGDFDVQSDTCSGSTVARSATCTMVVHFVPTSTGTRTATLTLTDGTAEKTAVVNLSGTGT